MDPRTTSASGLINLWVWAGRSGQMKKSTSDQYAMVCRRFLEPLGDLDSTIVGAVDIDDLVRRFHETAGGLQESTKELYERVFRRAVESFSEYLEDPASWQPPTKTRSAKSGRQVPVRPDRSKLDSGLIDIPITLPTGRTAQLVIPEKLSDVEADLLTNVIAAHLRAHSAESRGRSLE